MREGSHKRNMIDLSAVARGHGSTKIIWIGDLRAENCEDAQRCHFFEDRT